MKIETINILNSIGVEKIKDKIIIEKTDIIEPSAANFVFKTITDQIIAAIIAIYGKKDKTTPYVVAIPFPP